MFNIALDIMGHFWD